MQINAVKGQVHEQDQQIIMRTKEIRDLETELARVNSDILRAEEELSREQTTCQR